MKESESERKIEAAPFTFSFRLRFIWSPLWDGGCHFREGMKLDSFRLFRPARLSTDGLGWVFIVIVSVFPMGRKMLYDATVSVSVEQTVSQCGVTISLQ